MARTTGSHSDITGPRVAQAALRLFARHGYAAVSMRQIAAAVGVQAGALYNYTADKQSLLFDLMRGHMDELLAAWQALPGVGQVVSGSPQPSGQRVAQDPVARLEAFTRFHIRFHLERPDAVFVSYMELRNLTPENFARVEALRRNYEDALQDILRDGVAAGTFAVSDTKITTLAVIAMLTGVTTWYRPEGRLSGAEVELMYWDMVRRMVAV